MVTQLVRPWEAKYEDYLGDESKLQGRADSISFPATAEEAAAIVKMMAKSRTPITVQGGKTGICGGAVPCGGHILNLSQMNQSLGLRKTDRGYCLEVQAGLTLSELEAQLRRLNFDTRNWDEASLAALKALRQDSLYFWPPAPTETSATIGGILATNARGICAYLYGDTKQYVEEICLVDACGHAMKIRRGERRVREHQGLLPDGKTPVVNSDVLDLPPDLDLMDLYLGSEGIYGIIVGATLRLMERPRELWGIGFFFEQQDQLFQFAGAVSRAPRRQATAAIAAIEYLDKTTLDNIQQFKKVATQLNGLPHVAEKYIGMIYVELHGEQEGDIESIAAALLELADEYGIDEESTWAVSGEDKIEQFRAFRHAAPESINMALEKARQSEHRITKLAVDIGIPKKSFGELVTMYREDARAAAIEIAIFGHVAGNHLHVNILPQNYHEYGIGKKLIEKWTVYAAREGGIVFSEHGVGKVKKELFRLVVKNEILQNIRKIKKALDPNTLLNPGNVFDESSIGD